MLSLLKPFQSHNKDLFIDRFFDAYWSLNSDLENKEIVSEILKKINIDPVIFYQNITKQETKDNLKNITQQAFDKKIFGAPTFIVDNKIFWGQDRLDYALDEFKNYQEIQSVLKELNITVKNTIEKESTNYNIILGPISNQDVNNLVSSFVMKGYKNTKLILE